MPLRAAAFAALTVLTLLLAGCAAPASTDDSPQPSTSGPTRSDDTANKLPTPPPATALTPPTPPTQDAGAEGEIPNNPATLGCWKAKAKDADAPMPEIGTINAAPEVRRSDIAAVRQGIANARRYLDACFEADMAPEWRDTFAILLRNGTGNPTAGFARDNDNIHLVIDINYPGWAEATGAWDNAAERPKIAAHEFGHAWSASWGCHAQGAKIPMWLEEGWAEHVAYGASMSAGDMKELDVMRFMWTAAQNSDEMSTRLDAIPTWPGHAGFFAVGLLLDRAPSGLGAMRALCQDVGSGAAFEAAFESAFGMTLENLMTEWEQIRVSTPHFLTAPNAGPSGRPPPTPSARATPECFAQVKADPDAARLRVSADENVPEEDIVVMRTALAQVASFLEVCYRLPIDPEWANRTHIHIVNEGAGFNGGTWTVDRDGPETTVRFDIGHPSWQNLPHEWTKPIARRSLAGSVMAVLATDAAGCTPMGDGNQPIAWLREAVIHYATQSSQIASGATTKSSMRDFLWQQAHYGNSLGKPLSTWTTYQPDSWPGHIAYFAMEKLVANADDGPASVATMCASFARGVGVSSAFTHAFGEPFTTVSQDAQWATQG